MLNAMSIDGFLMYLSSAEGAIFNPHQRDLYQDMCQPLCHYFISSSHNTYLMEDQLRGQSSVEGYIRYNIASLFLASIYTPYSLTTYY